MRGKKEETRPREEKGTGEMYANDLEQDYKMASLIPVTVLNFARFLLSSLLLAPSLFLSAFFFLLYLSLSSRRRPSPFFAAAILLLTAAPRCLPNRRKAAAPVQRGTPGG